MNSNLDRQFAIEVVRQLQSAGYEALWAGGCVRDLLLGNMPDDFDVATSATPAQVRELFGKKRTLAIGEAFGVIVVLPPRKYKSNAASQTDFSKANQIEVATFRTDGGYSDGRRPDSVTFSSAEEDALRRDFTINGMFYDPLTEKVQDYVRGQVDLQAEVIRAIGNAEDRISEDKLRMLRAIRFAARFGFAIEEKTRSAVAAHASEISAVSSERISVEIQKTLATSRAAWGMQQWLDLGLLPAILPAVANSWTNSGEAILQTLEANPDASWQTKLACALYFASVSGSDKPQDLHQVARALTQEMKQHLKLSNQDVAGLEYAIAAQTTLEQANALPWSQVQPVLIHPHYELGNALLAARLAAEDGEHRKLPILEWLARQKDLPDLDPEPLLQGQDLMNSGLKPGPEFKQILDQARQMQLDDLLSDRAAALEWLKSQASA